MTSLPAKRLFSKGFGERGNLNVVKWEVLPIETGDQLRLVFENSASEWRQGVFLMTNGNLEFEAVSSPRIVLWRDTAPHEVQFTCQKTDGRLHVYNVWDSGSGVEMESQSYSSGMLVDPLPSGARYRCNCIGFDGNFDDLVFRLERKR